MSVQGWRYYNHAMLPDGQPDKEPDLTPVENGEIWSNVHGGGGRHFLLDGQRTGIAGTKPDGGTLLRIRHLTSMR